ncbi:hypothetical protein LJC48_00330 [Desulfovibrio sp. OttesenSCG-928-C06]|nr:hypothetical protein [Desulfovibrio sp. OttesenSCG-928-C06]
MSDHPSLPQNVIDAFHLMWSKFPGPVTLVHRSRMIMAANPVAVSIGRNPGIKCSQIPPASAHAGCLADKTLDEGLAKLKLMITPEYQRMAYWVPIEGHPEYFLHFSTALSDKD